jgi:hypothetical protein
VEVIGALHPCSTACEGYTKIIWTYARRRKTIHEDNKSIIFMLHSVQRIHYHFRSIIFMQHGVQTIYENNLSIIFMLHGIQRTRNWSTIFMLHGAQRIYKIIETLFSCCTTYKGYVEIIRTYGVSAYLPNTYQMS